MATGDNVDAERLKRWQTIAKPFSLLSQGIPPPTDVPVDDLIVLGSRIKEEGNAMFNDSQYDAAVELYSAAIVVYDSLLARRSAPIDKQRASLLYSNRAFCWLKMGLLGECIDDCDQATELHDANVKAYYRKAVALLELSKLREAFITAQTGRKFASGKTATEFEDLLTEIYRQRMIRQPVHVMPDYPQSARDTGSPNDMKVPQTPSAQNVAAKNKSDGVTKETSVTTRTAKKTGKVVSENLKSTGPKNKPNDNPVPSGTSATVKKDSNKTTNSEPSAQAGSRQAAQTSHEASVKKKRRSKRKRKQEIVVKKDSESSSSSSDSSDDEEGNVESSEYYGGKFSALKLSDEKDRIDDVMGFQQVTSRRSRLLPSTSDTESVKSAASNISSSNKTSKKKSSNAAGPSTNVPKPANWPQNAGPQKQTTPMQTGDNCPTTQGSSTTTTTKSAAAASSVFSSSPLLPSNWGFGYVLACFGCFQDGQATVRKNGGHKCQENVLVVQNRKTKQVFRIRERKNHVNFLGKYHMCTYASAGVPCPRADHCSFAHNGPEILFWTLDKDGKFNVTDFIRKASTRKDVDISTPEKLLLEFFRKHPGQLSFICRLCYTVNRCISVQNSKDLSKCARDNHSWSASAILAHSSGGNNGAVTPIGSRPTVGETQYYSLCQMLQYCRNKWTAACTNAHSIIEMEFWFLERATSLSQSELMFRGKTVRSSPVEPPPLGSRTSPWQPPPTTSSVARALSPAPSRPVVVAAAAGAAALSPPPYKLAEVCSKCWDGKIFSQRKSQTATQCAIRGHAWVSSNVVHLIMPAKLPLRPLPKKYPQTLDFTICWDIINKSRCDRPNGCNFAHSKEEVKMWQWMATHQAKTAEAVVEWVTCNTRQTPTAAAATVAAPPAVSARPAWSDVSLPKPAAAAAAQSLFETIADTYVCMYCNVTCNSENQLNCHFMSAKHKLNVTSDKEREWNFRPPPKDIPIGNYQLCEKHKQQWCRYSDVIDCSSTCSNHCRMAHSQAELDEWKERYQWRMMKKQVAKEQNLFSYMDLLIDELESAKNVSAVMVDSLTGVTLIFSNDLHCYSEEKNAEFSWKFDMKLESKHMLLDKVALLYDEHRHHFVIDNPIDKNCQLSAGDLLQVPPDKNHVASYRVKVNFTGGMFGSFTQTIVFDFGQRPVLGMKLKVELGDRDLQEKVEQLREDLYFNRWTRSNRDIVSCHTVTGEMQKLLECYKPPVDVDEIIGHQTLSGSLNQNNYVHRMRRLLQLEELTQAKLVSQLNIKTAVKLLNVVEEETCLYACQGELFARVPLGDKLNEDTDAGHLVLWTVRSVLLALDNQQNSRVYEALVLEHKDQFTAFNRGYGRDYVYLRLSARCCEELKLKADTSVTFEIQFQLDRLLFCRMHCALDKLECADLLFPDLSLLLRQQPVANCLDLTSKKISLLDDLNEDQRKIVEHVTSLRSRWIAPLVVFGAFGTGKTETLARAALALLQTNPDVRILICTHTHMTANEYIIRFDDHISKAGNVTQHTTQQQLAKSILRFVDADRRVVTMPPTVQKYCLMAEDRSQFIAPTTNDILEHKIIVTTMVTSFTFGQLGVRGRFSHIFVDEAAQVLECEVVIPLSLASDNCNTCVVLAGDHLQMGEKVYSDVARDRLFDKSIVERLFSHYEHAATRNKKAPLPNILLRTNYRSHPKILGFLSSVFYGGPEALVSKSVQPTSTFPPLNFYVACGQEVQAANSTSWYNLAEVHEIVERVRDMVMNWPREHWGERDIKSILVTTAYSEQEKRIRHALREQRLSGVTVLRVQNLPGTEFRAVFISTVRSRHLVATNQLDDLAGGEFGFLSEQKLLNTALTRAKSWIGVVGDPVALCEIGDCSEIWKMYVKHCCKEGSMVPRTLKFEDIYIQVRQLVALTSAVAKPQLPAKTASLAPKVQISSGVEVAKKVNLVGSGATSSVVSAAPNASRPVPQPSPLQLLMDRSPGFSLACAQRSEKVPVTNAPQRAMADVATQPVESAVARRKEVCETEAVADMIPGLVTNIGAVQNSQLNSDNAVLSFEEWSLDYQVEPDEIIRQLARTTSMPSRGHVVADVWLAPTSQKQKIRVEEKDGHAFIKYQQSGRSTLSGRKLISAAEFDDDVDSKEDEDDDITRNETGKLSKEELSNLVRTQPKVYKECVAHIDCSASMHARPVDKSFARILLGSRLRCGHAFHNDLVVVEILKMNDSRQQRNSTQPSSVAKATVKRSGLTRADIDFGAPLGRVVGIVKRSLEPKYRMFVCQVEEGNTARMVPLNRGVPKMYNLEREDYPAKPGKVLVYSFTKTKNILFDKYSRNTSMLYIVRYLKWDEGFNSPLGIVIGEIPPGETVDQAMRILDIEHNIPKKFKEDSLFELKMLSIPTYQNSLPPKWLVRRTDFRERLVFTIDPPTSRDLDDALSLEDLPNGGYVIGIHIADVAHFVRKDGSIDSEAKARGSTFYGTACAPTPMLPPHLSEDLCSLLPNRDRLTISVFLTIDASAKVLSARFERCVVRSRYRLTYDEAERMIANIPGGREFPDELSNRICRLHRIAKVWRRKRLGVAALYQQPELSNLDSPLAHSLVEEMMIAANHQVAMKMMSDIPTLAVLRTQKPPDVAELSEWRQMFAEVSRNAVVFNSLFHPVGDVCQCPAECNALPPPPPPLANNQSLQLDILPSVLDRMETAVENFDATTIRRLVISPEYHPSLAVAALYLNSIQEHSDYVCGGDLPDDDDDQRGHHSLRLPAYTHFTSPIRRYADLIVHRLVGSIIDGAPSGYTGSDITNLCNLCTDASLRARRYEKATMVVQLCDLLRQRPVLTGAFIYSVSEADVQLFLPVIQRYFPSFMKLELSWLHTEGKPTYDEAEQLLSLKWKQQIYELKPDVVARNFDEIQLNANSCVSTVRVSAFRNLVRAVNRENLTDTEVAVENVLSSVSLAARSAEPTSEGKPVQYGKYFCEYALELKPAGVWKVQVSTELYRGFLRPCIQTVQLTDRLEICVAHAKNPVECFSKVATECAAIERYRSIRHYQNLWLPVISMEAARGAVDGQHTSIINNVQIEWKERIQHAQTEPSYSGLLKLPSQFCQERGIRFALDGEPDDEEGLHLEQDLDEERAVGYMCVRYRDVSVPVPATDVEFDRLIDLGDHVTWIGHCVVTRATKTKDKLNYNVYLKLFDSNLPLPRQFLVGVPTRLATVEWIVKSLPDRRMVQAILKLGGGRSLAECIAKNDEMPSLDPEYISFASVIARDPLSSLPPANDVQQSAILQSMTQPFSLIQGPPGTGKTMTATRLALLFVKLNFACPSCYCSDNAVKPQVMICGPSNKSVDVVAVKLKDAVGTGIRIIRVYSETVEHEDFPMPGHVVKFRTRSKLADRDRDRNLASISLHHLIREGDGPHAQLIRKVDEMIRSFQRTVDAGGPLNYEAAGLDNDMLEAYRQVIAAREAELLHEANVVLCTCTVSSAKKIRASTNIVQLIIDECAMCKEPESLVPIVSTGAKQVVLVGDHKQLQPIIQESRAEKFGLGRSLFERYASRAVMLTTQYRMHEAIMAFPSERFYDGQLMIGSPDQALPSQLPIWPSGGDAPIVFVDVVGVEETLTVSTEEGSLKSKSNQQEIALVIHAIRKLARYGVNQSEIAVLSQYRAQTFQLTEQLKSNYPHVTVSTVVAAQGSEWPYVILSTVRSLPAADIDPSPSLKWRTKNLGFITDEHQFNVAVTRAKKGFFIIGNRMLLQCDPLWQQLLEHYDGRGKIVEASRF